MEIVKDKKVYQCTEQKKKEPKVSTLNTDSLRILRLERQIHWLRKNLLQLTKLHKDMVVARLQDIVISNQNLNENRIDLQNVVEQVNHNFQQVANSVNQEGSNVTISNLPTISINIGVAPDNSEESSSSTHAGPQDSTHTVSEDLDPQLFNPLLTVE